MGSYQTRSIRFREVVQTDGWRTKVYTISKTGEFDHPVIYQRALEQLPHWLQRTNGFNDEHEGTAFLILHAGTEGVFSLIHWWVGREMLSAHIFLAELGSPDVFTEISGQGLAPCVWELAVIGHEREAWIRHALQPAVPDYEGYCRDVMNGDV